MSAAPVPNHRCRSSEGIAEAFVLLALAASKSRSPGGELSVFLRTAGICCSRAARHSLNLELLKSQGASKMTPHEASVHKKNTVPRPL